MTLVTTLASCATGVPQVLSPAIVPKTFVGSAAETESVWPRLDWWEGFGSSELSVLIAAAGADNRALAVSAAQVREARAKATIQRAALFPQLSAQVEAQRSVAIATQPVNNQRLPPSNSFGFNLGASYEFDIWGVERDNLRAAHESLKSTVFARQALALVLTANVANTYFSVLALRERTAIANEDIAAINGILDVIKLKVSTGKSSHLDLAQEQAQVEAVEAQLPVLQEQEAESLVALAVLLGRRPERFEVLTQSLDGIRPPIVEPGLPSDLLLRRPDVAQAEANLASAHANLDAARAAFLPQFGLTGNGGFASAAIGALLRGPSFAWAAGVNLLQTIFDGGKLIGQRDLAEATQTELIASYQGAVLNAYADVENSLSQVTNNSKAESHLRREIESAHEAFQISQLQYRQGTIDLLTVLQAQQTLFGARDQLAQTTLARLQAVIHLYEALGGGWMEPSGDRTQFTRDLQ